MFFMWLIRCMCPHIDIDVPFLLPGWSIEHRDGQYRAAWPKKNAGTVLVGKRRLIRKGGSVIPVDSLTLVAVVAPNRVNAPTWALPPAGFRQRCWTPDDQSYPMLGHQQTEPLQRPTGEHPGNHRSDWMPPKPAQTVVQNLR